MKKVPLLLFGLLVLLPAIPASAGPPLSPTELNCIKRIALGTNRYICRKHSRVAREVNRVLSGLSAHCTTSFRCLGGGNHGSLCNPALANGDCPMGECQPDHFTGASLARYIMAQQNLFKSQVYAACTVPGVSLAAAGYPNADCPYATDFDEVVDCILRSNSGYPSGGGPVPSGVVDTVLEPLRTSLGHLQIPFTPYPSRICGTPGSWLLDWGSSGGRPAAGREGYTRNRTTQNCTGSTCQTIGEGVIGNMLDAPETMYAGATPFCLVQRMKDSSNGTVEQGFIDLTSGEEGSFYNLSLEITSGACPKCSTATLLCAGGPNNGGPCVRRGAEDVSCPPTGPPAVTVSGPLVLATEPAILSVPANNPAGGATNPTATFCGSCDLDSTVGCQNDSDCVANAACSGSVGSGCCQFGTNTGFAFYPSATTVSGGGARGPIIPHLTALRCLGTTGIPGIDATAGLAGPFRYIEPRVNTVEY